MRSEPAPHCLCCGVEGRVLYSALSDLLYGISGEWDVRQCEACGLLWLDPMPVASDIGLAYATYHTHASDAGVTHSSKLARSKGAARAAILSAYYGYRSHNDHGWIQPIGRALGALRPLRNAAGSYVMWLQAAPGARLLDVGCGSGALLEQMAGLGWQVSGVEADPRAAGIARGRGLDVRTGDVLAAGFEPREFDAIVLRHVIEHLHDPVAALSHCSRLLAPGGRLVVLTPNYRSRGHARFGESWRGLEPPRHLHLFTVQCLKDCVASAGLRVETARTVAARTARMIWRESDAQLHQPAARRERPNNHAANLWQRMKAGWFEAVESRLLSFAEIGEEVLVVARGRTDQDVLSSWTDRV